MRSEQSRARAKAVGLWLGREWLCVGESCGERGRWFAFIRTWGERPLSIILSGAVPLLIFEFILANLNFCGSHLF